MTTLEKLDELLRVARAATQVVNWYSHGPYDGYHPGEASVRGPFFRWLIVKEGDGWDKSKPKPVADVEDDAKFAAMAMNNLVPLVESLREAVETIEAIQCWCEKAKRAGYKECTRCESLAAINAKIGEL